MRARPGPLAGGFCRSTYASHIKKAACILYMSDQKEKAVAYHDYLLKGFSKKAITRDTAGDFLDSVLEKNSNVKVYMPFSTSSEEKNRISEYGTLVLTENAPKEIIEGVFLTGEMGDEIKEQSLILDTQKGVVIITGCSHPGIINILKRAKEILNKKIYLVIGGFHLLQHSDDEVVNIIEQFKSLGVDF